MGLLSSITNLVGGISKKNAAKRAARQQEEALLKAQAQMRETYGQQRELQDPYLRAGITGQNELLRLLGLGGDAGSEGYGSMAKAFGMDQFQADPGYAFRLSEGLKAMDRAAAARGGLISGAALKAGQRYGQEMGSQEYQNAFNRYQTERQARLDPLYRMTGAGQQAANTMGGYAGTYGASMSDLLTGVGNVKASGTMGASNALWGGIGNFAKGMDEATSNALTRGSAYTRGG